MAQSLFSLAIGIAFLALSASAAEKEPLPGMIPIGGFCVGYLDPYCQGYPNSHCEICFGCKSPPNLPNAPMFGSCECNEGFVPGKLYGCLPVSGAGESCTIAEQCRQGAADKDSDCVQGTCQCGEGYVQDGNTCVKAEEISPKVIIPIGGLCLDGTSPYCQGYPFSHCDVCFGCKKSPAFPNAPFFGTCECNEGYVAGALYGCLPVRGAGESCRVSEQCQNGAAEKNSDCVDGTCQCGEGYVQEGKFCFPETKPVEISPKVIIPIGGLCLGGTDPYCQGFPFSHCEVCFGCKTSPVLPNAPMFGTCQCNDGWVSTGLYGCLPKRGANQVCQISAQCHEGAAGPESNCVLGVCRCKPGSVAAGKGEACVPSF